MATQDLNIHLNLLDNVTSGLSKVNSSITAMGKNIEQVGRSMNQLGSKMLYLGGALTGLFTVALKTASNYSIDAANGFRELSNIFIHLQLTIAEAILPTFRSLVAWLADIVDKFRALAPETRDFALKIAFLAGVFLVIGGTVMKLAGAFVFLAGSLISNPIVLIIAAIGAAVVWMIVQWDKVRQYVLPVIKNIEIALNYVTLAQLKVTKFVVEGFDKMLGKLKDFLTSIRNIATATGDTKTVENMNKAIEAIFASQLKYRTATRDTIKIIQGAIDETNVKIKELKDGTDKGFADTVDSAMYSLKNSIQTIWDFMTGLFNGTRRGWNQMMQQEFEWANFSKDIIKSVAASMETSMGNFFYNALTGQLKDAKEAFADFGRTIIQIASQAAAKMLLFFTVGRALEPMLGLNMFGKYHSGGVVRAHSGMAVGSDEVPIIAQSGEGILSRKGMNALGGANNLGRLNRGEGVGGSGQTIYVTQVIHAWDAKDVSRNIKSLSAGIIEGIRKNSDFRLAMKQYA